MDVVEQLAEELAHCRAQAADDPFTNALLLFSLQLSRRLASGEMDAEALAEAVAGLTAQGFAARADRFGGYLGESDPAKLEAGLATLFGGLAEAGGFDAYARAVAAAPFGIVLTAHPTFALNLELSQTLVALATGRGAQGSALSPADRETLLQGARALPQGPPDPLTLDVEHDWSVEALQNAHTAMEVVYRVALRLARDRWPDRWTELTPALLTLATWVGFDQDGRTDITWQVSFAKRLALKRAALARRLQAVEALRADAKDNWRDAVDGLAATLRRALEIVDGQAGLLDAAQAEPGAVAAFARGLVEGRDAALVVSAPLLEKIDAALALAPGDLERERLLVLRAGVATEGVSLARIHVRLNAGQLHNAVRRRVKLETSPADPANRRSYFAAIDALIAETRPVAFNLGDLAAEPASAPRLMMSVALMRRFVDASTPTRFLIAETESGFTLLAALYFARLFGVEDEVEISPLFETPEAFERGEKVIEEALRSEHYRASIKRQGRLAIEFGFSDSGRFIGQPAATFRIERLRFRLADMLKREGLGGLEVIFFNTHGESIGRGGHPGGLSDRFRYAAPPRSRADFAARGIAVREEDAFQGGEGYLPLLSPAAALATVCAALRSVLLPDPEAEGDPIYDDPDFATEFFATAEQAFAGVVADPDYAALIGMFGTHLLPKTGSRPVQRQVGDAGGVRTLGSVSELRAIPNNALLQQLGYMANSVFGVGLAATKHLEAFRSLYARSPRFRRAMQMVGAARAASDVDVARGYAATLDPTYWLERAAGDADPTCDRRVEQMASRAGLSDRLGRFLRRLQAEDLDLTRALEACGDLPKEDERRRRLLLLHGLRLAMIQRLSQLAVQFPRFEPRGEINEASLRERLVRLDAPAALDDLRRFFPRRAPTSVEDAEFGEPSDYASEQRHAYEAENVAVFDPIERLFDLIRAITTAIGHEVGAYG